MTLWNTNLYKNQFFCFVAEVHHEWNIYSPSTRICRTRCILKPVLQEKNSLVSWNPEYFRTRCRLINSRIVNQIVGSEGQKIARNLCELIQAKLPTFDMLKCLFKPELTCLSLSSPLHSFMVFLLLSHSPTPFFSSSLLFFSTHGNALTYCPRWEFVSYLSKKRKLKKFNGMINMMQKIKKN